MAMNPFDFVSAISYSKKDIMTDDIEERGYDSFLVNRSLSYFVDTVLYASEMNLYPALPNRLKYDYLINTIKPKKRFSKWAKKVENNDLSVVMEYYRVNQIRAEEILSILSPKQLVIIKEKLQTGGKV
jgi:hypothetical protein